MDKEEPNFSIWGEISDSALVLEAAKVEQKYEKQRFLYCKVRTSKLTNEKARLIFFTGR